jgi:hypothetical protein
MSTRPPLPLKFGPTSGHSLRVRIFPVEACTVDPKLESGVASVGLPSVGFVEFSQPGRRITKAPGLGESRRSRGRYEITRRDSGLQLSGHYQEGDFSFRVQLQAER